MKNFFCNIILFVCLFMLLTPVSIHAETTLQTAMMRRDADFGFTMHSVNSGANQNKRWALYARKWTFTGLPEMMVDDLTIEMSSDYVTGTYWNCGELPWDGESTPLSSVYRRLDPPVGAEVFRVTMRGTIDSTGLFSIDEGSYNLKGVFYSSEETLRIAVTATGVQGEGGDVRLILSESDEKGQEYIAYRNSLYAASSITCWSDIVVKGNAGVTLTNPIILSNDNLRKIMNADVNWSEGLTASWGISTGKLIPTLGSITDITKQKDELNKQLSSTGLKYDQVGHQYRTYRVEDDDALGATYPFDNTYTDTSRWITVATDQSHDLQTYLQGTSTIYTNDYWLATQTSTTADATRKYGVDIEAQTITPGEYDFTIKQAGVTTPLVSTHTTNFLPGATTKKVGKTNYTTDSPTSAGESFTSVLLATNLANPGTPLTPEVPLSPVSGPKVVMIDSLAPKAPIVTTPTGVDEWSTIDPDDGDVAGLGDNGASGIPTVHDDGYYYKFVTAGESVTTPSGNDSGWKSVAQYTKETMPGSYDLYVYAKDRATNRSPVTKANTLGPIIVSGVGEVKMTMTTEQGATIHGEGCPDYESVDLGDDCDGNCKEGTHKDVMQGSDITYKIELENTAPSTGAEGLFVNYLPAGIDKTTPPILVVDEDAVLKFKVELDGDRWKVTCSYDLAGGSTTEITISCKAPGYADITSESKTFSNQAELDYTIGTGDGATSGSTKSNYATHRVNEPAKISKTANQGAAIHDPNCPNSTSLKKIDGCKTNCVAGNTGLVEEGDVIEYKLNFENPSKTTQYFATDASGFYDKMPDGVSIADREWTVKLSDNAGNEIYEDSGDAPGAGTGIIADHSDAQGNHLTGLGFDVDNNGVFQSGTNTLSLAPGAKLEITIRAEVTSAGSDNLVNQVKSGYKLYANNTAALTTDDTAVMKINSNYVTHIRTVYGVDTKFTKVGADDLDAPLQGAKFALYKWLGTPAEYATHEDDILDVTKLNGGIAGDKWLRATTNGADGTLGDEFTTPASGEIDLGKLPDGIYTLIETSAPEGYELPVGQWILTIDHNKKNTGDNDYQIEYMAKGEMLPPATIRTDGASAGAAPTYKIVNVRPFSIGMSGMNGTKGITITGLAIMLLVGVIYSVYNNKKQKGQKKSKTLRENKL